MLTPAYERLKDDDGLEMNEVESDDDEWNAETLSQWLTAELKKSWLCSLLVNGEPLHTKDYYRQKSKLNDYAMKYLTKNIKKNLAMNFSQTHKNFKKIVLTPVY